MTPFLLPVILAGGIGARLAPISTDTRPKPFVPLADGESLLTKTLARVTGPQFLPPVIIGRAQDRFALLNHARAAGVAPAAILLEASMRNTAAAVALAAQWAMARYGESLCLAVLPADHLIAPAEGWCASLTQAATASREQGRVALLTATPTTPDPAFGYVLTGPKTARHPWQHVAQFVEKPHEPERWIAQGARWNMGQFIGLAGQFRTVLQEHAPLVWEATKALLATARHHWEFTELDAWPDAIQSLPFDHAVLERAASVAVPFTGHWQDLGSLEAWRAFIGRTPDDYARLPQRIDRPWGYFESRESGFNYALKHLILYPGCRLSLQKHQHRNEHWRVISGIACVELDGAVIRLENNQEIEVKAGQWHRLANHHTDILIIEEKQFGNCDEDDIERMEDDYGRSSHQIKNYSY